MADEILANGKTYDVSDLRSTYPDIVTSGTGEALPKYIAIIRDLIADAQKPLLAYSSSSVAVSAGTKVFVLDIDVPFAGGRYVDILRLSAPTTTKMYADIASYDSETKTLTVSVAAADVTGTGTYTDWVIYSTSKKGPTGSATIDIDSLGSTTATAIDADDVLAISVDTVDSKITTTEFKKYLNIGDYSNRFTMSGTIIDGTYIIDAYIPVAKKITKVRAYSRVGSGTVQLRNITGAASMTHTALSVSTSGAEQSVTAANTVAVGETFGLVLTGASSDLTDIFIAYETEYA